MTFCCIMLNNILFQRRYKQTAVCLLLPFILVPFILVRSRCTLQHTLRETSAACYGIQQELARINEAVYFATLPTLPNKRYSMFLEEFLMPQYCHIYKMFTHVWIYSWCFTYSTWEIYVRGTRTALWCCRTLPGLHSAWGGAAAAAGAESYPRTERRSSPRFVCKIEGKVYFLSGK